MSVTVHQFACLDDNYGFLLRDDASGEVASIDTPDAEAILREAAGLNWIVSTIFNTHWHPDHAGGNAAIKAQQGAIAFGPTEVAQHYPLDREVHGCTVLHLGKTRIEVIDTGGHTLGHIAYYLPDESILFVGDTLFPMGCGRVFEGTAQQMWSSLDRLAALPASTIVYSAHEYTLGNARFALSVDDCPLVAERAAQVAMARARGEATVPTTIGKERATNPFLRAPVLPMTAGAANEAAAFALVRSAKDSFSG